MMKMITIMTKMVIMVMNSVPDDDDNVYDDNDDDLDIDGYDDNDGDYDDDYDHVYIYKFSGTTDSCGCWKSNCKITKFCIEEKICGPMEMAVVSINSYITMSISLAFSFACM